MMVFCMRYVHLLSKWLSYIAEVFILFRQGKKTTNKVVLVPQTISIRE